MPTLDPRKVPTLYVIVMAAWIYGFAAADRNLPAMAVFVLLLMGAAVQVAAGYSIGRWAAIGLAGVPVLLGVVAGGLDSSLWTTLLILMVFPGAPLIGLGVHLRRLEDERNDRSPDSWLYGEEPGSV